MREDRAFHQQIDTQLRGGGEVAELVLAYELNPGLPADLTACEESMLAERARQGDLEAFDAIMMRYENRLLRFLVGLVGDVEVARELCQDTFLAAFQAMPRLRGELKLSSWLHTIALNRARSHHRKKRFRVLLSLEDEVLPANGPDLQDSLASHDTVQRTLARMPRNYAYPLLLQTASGLSCREIADVLHCSEGAVKVRLMRARESFKQLYELEARDACAG